MAQPERKPDCFGTKVDKNGRVELVQHQQCRGCPGWANMLNADPHDWPIVHCSATGLKVDRSSLVTRQPET